MKKISFIGLALLFCFAITILVGCGGCRRAPSVEGALPVERVRFATGGVAGVYYPFGTAIATTVTERTGIPITVQSTGASRANIQLIHAGEVEMALVQTDVMDYAWRGVNLFQADGQVRSFRTVAALYSEVCQVVVNPASGIRSIADLRGRNVSVGDVGSGVEFNASQILDAYGITFADINRQNLSFAASADAFRDGRIDAFFVTSGAPNPAVVDLALGRDIIILPVSEASAARLIANHPFYSRYSIPAGTYRGQTAPVSTVAVRATLVVSEGLRDDTVYNLTRALFQYRSEIAVGHARGNDIDSAYAVEGVGIIPFHPGAQRYFREIGALR